MLWPPYFRVHIDRIEKVQNRFLICTAYKSDIHMDNYEQGAGRKSLNLQTLESRRKLFWLSTLYKLFDNTIDCNEVVSKFRINVPSNALRNEVTPKSTRHVRAKIIILSDQFSDVNDECLSALPNLPQQDKIMYMDKPVVGKEGVKGRQIVLSEKPAIFSIETPIVQNTEEDQITNSNINEEDGKASVISSILNTNLNRPLIVSNTANDLDSGAACIFYIFPYLKHVKFLRIVSDLFSLQLIQI